ISGLLALVTSETIVGGIGFGAIAVIAAEVGSMGGMIKILLDAIDALLGVVQILILIDRIKHTKDPAERAVLAAQLGRECNQLAGIVTGLVVQVATLVVSAGLAAGASALFAKSLKGFRRALVDELDGQFSFNPRESIAKMRDAATPKVPEPVRTTTNP